MEAIDAGRHVASGERAAPPHPYSSSAEFRDE